MTAGILSLSLVMLEIPMFASVSQEQDRTQTVTILKDSKSEKQDKENTKERKPEEPTLPLEFTQVIDSRKVKKGDVVTLKVVDDTAISDKLRFRKDAPASGIIEDVKEPGRFGQRAQIKIRLDWVKDINGAQVPLASYTTGNRFEPGAGGASLGGLLFLGPVGLLGGAFIKGGHLTIKKGTRIQARVLPAKS